ncbi:NAD(P)/FAD-dependent oxidoreductase [Chloroflexota bacterium]
MADTKSEEVVILGGGVFGFSTAYHLAKEGILAQVIEVDSIGSKASGKADGMTPDALGNFFYGGSSYTEGGVKPLFVPFGGESYRRFPQLHSELKEETGVDFQFASGPQLNCALSEEEAKVIKGMASEARKTGFKVEWISGDEARAMESTLSEEVRGAVLNDIGQVEPYRYTLALAQGAEKMGVNIKYAEAVGFRWEKNRVISVILSNGSEILAEVVVIAMGPWSGQALSWLGLKLPVSTLRAQTLKLMSSKCPQYQLNFKPVMVSEWPHVYMLISPRVDGTILVGYTEDRTGNWDDNRPETWIDSPSTEMKDIMIEQAARFVPILKDAELVEQRAAVLGYPPAEGMVIGPLPEWANVYMTMIGDNGIAVSPAVGRIMTDLIVKGERVKKAMDEVKTVTPERFIL